jgi:hypothetical protein
VLRGRVNRRLRARDPAQLLLELPLVLLSWFSISFQLKSILAKLDPPKPKPEPLPPLNPAWGRATAKAVTGNERP